MTSCQLLLDLDGGESHADSNSNSQCIDLILSLKTETPVIVPEPARASPADGDDVDTNAHITQWMRTRSSLIDEEEAMESRYLPTASSLLNDDEDEVMDMMREKDVGMPDDSDVLFSQHHRRSRVTFVGLDDEVDEATGDDVGKREDPFSFLDNRGKPMFDEYDEEEDARPTMPSEAGAAAAALSSTSGTGRAGGGTGVVADPRFVPATTSSLSTQHQPAAAANRTPSASVSLMTCQEVHRIFQSHWEELRQKQTPFFVFSSSLAASEAMHNDSQAAKKHLDDVFRHQSLVNISNWSGNPAADVRLPAVLIAPPPPPQPHMGGRGGPPPARVPLLKKHQVEGIRFMWQNLMEAPITRVPAVGCILAHSMGLGKTGQVVVLLHLMTISQQSFSAGRFKVVVVAPKSVLSSWEGEFAKWSAAFPEGSRISPTVIDDRLTKDSRVEQFTRCMTHGGVVLIGYEALVHLEKELMSRYAEEAIGGSSVQQPFPRHDPSLSNMSSSSKLRSNNTSRGGASDDGDASMMSSTSSSSKPFQSGFRIDLVVCDEGHRLKSSDLDIAKSLGRLHAARRLILTGTPMQNHLLEYWAMSDFALPKFFDRRSFLTYFVKPIEKAADANASEADISNAKKKTFVLIKEFAHFTQRVDSEPLKDELPPLHEYVVTVSLSVLQHQLYLSFLDIIRRDHGAHFNVLQAFSYASKICAHPLLLFQSEGAISAGPYRRLISGDMARNYVFRSEDGQKLQVALGIIRAAMALGEKTLVFSMSTKMLDLFETMMTADSLRKEMGKKRPRREEDDVADVLDVDKESEEDKEDDDDDECDNKTGDDARQTRRTRISFLRIDGGSSGTDRERRIREFQSDSSKYHCFLLSTKAGSVGITVTAATRVIILDCSFNPADDRQAIGRAYRYGQTKPVFVYRLVCRNTIEHRIFDQKIGKEWIFETVVNDRNVKRESLSGVKLRHIFLMKESRPHMHNTTATSNNNNNNAVVVMPEGLRLATEACCLQDPVLAEVRPSGICSVASHEFYLGADLDEQYGAEELDHYTRYRRKGGLQQSEPEAPELRERLNRESQLQWQEVKRQSMTLSSLVDKIVADRASANPHIRNILKRLGVIDDVVAPPATVDVVPQQTSGGSGTRVPLLGQFKRPVVSPIFLLDDDEEDDEELDAKPHAAAAPVVARPTTTRQAPSPSSKSSSLVNPLHYAAWKPGSSRDNAVDVDDD